jgi:NAD-dependent SIR2 family protein deacetylase
VSGTVLFLGAGATKSVQGPLTDEILPKLYESSVPFSATDPSGRVAKLIGFLQQEFHLRPALPKEQYPSLPLLLSLIDMALDRRELFAQNWDVDALAELRQQIELGIFDVLEEALIKFPTNNHYSMLDSLFPAPDSPAVITTNYDLVVDTALMFLSEHRQPGGGIPNYYCGMANMAMLPPNQKFGTLLKLHGSLNWLYCRTCQRLELGATESTRFISKFQHIVGRDLRSSLTADGAPCPVCGRPLRPMLVAPSHLKDYRNPHLGQVWYEAQRVLRQADSVVFVGYSLPDDDVEVVYLLKRGLAHIQDPKKITVVEYCKDYPEISAQEHSAGRRYGTLFGDIDWHANGLDGWLQKRKAVGQS